MEYTDDQIETMREILWTNEFEMLSERDLMNVLWDGCVGYNNATKQEIIDGFEDYYQEEEERNDVLKYCAGPPN